MSNINSHIMNFSHKNSLTSSYKGQVSLYLGDCLEKMDAIKKNSIHLICADLPYGTTQNKWDEVIPLDIMWKKFNEVLAPNGVIVLTAAQPFTSKLICSNLKQFKYDIIWEKTICSGQLNVKKQPLRAHESILVFYLIG